MQQVVGAEQFDQRCPAQPYRLAPVLGLGLVRSVSTRMRWSPKERAIRPESSGRRCPGRRARSRGRSGRGRCGWSRRGTARRGRPGCTDTLGSARIVRWSPGAGMPHPVLPGRAVVRETVVVAATYRSLPRRARRSRTRHSALCGSRRLGGGRPIDSRRGYCATRSRAFANFARLGSSTPLLVR